MKVMPSNRQSDPQGTLSVAADRQDERRSLRATTSRDTASQASQLNAHSDEALKAHELLSSVGSAGRGWTCGVGHHKHHRRLGLHREPRPASQSIPPGAAQRRRLQQDPFVPASLARQRNITQPLRIRFVYDLILTGDATGGPPLSGSAAPWGGISHGFSP